MNSLLLNIECRQQSHGQRRLDKKLRKRQVGTLESRIDATETQLRTTESERDAVRSKARAQSVAMAAKKRLDDSRRAEGVGTTEGGKIDQLGLIGIRESR